ncbi:MAG: hypothetical protein GXY74_01315 [Phycisphaerae bacterium]|nr:hypothetical protein [Phycisphaerae bacterium]
MKKNNVKLGAVYAVKVSGSVVPVRLDRESSHGGWLGTNMTTRKEVRVKSAQRLRGLWPKKTMPIVADKSEGKADDNGVAETVAAVEKGNLAEGVTVPEAKKERHSLLNLAAKVLAEAGQPLNCKEMVERVLATGLWTSDGKTPSATLYSAILRETRTKGEAARFRKVERGKFEAVTK